MCRFKSGIILKNRCVIAQGADDSHSTLLEGLGIKDTAENAMTKFVRAELLPPEDEWWTNPDTWEAHIDQDILPEWFDTDREKYINDFRSAVKDWWEKYVLVDKEIDVLSNGYYRLKRCQVKKLMNDVMVLLDSSTVQDMRDSSTVQDMRDSSTVQSMWDSSTVQNMWGSSTVQGMRDSSTVQRMWGSSTVQSMCDSSIIARDQNNDIHTAQDSQSKIVRHNNAG